MAAQIAGGMDTPEDATTGFVYWKNGVRKSKAGRAPAPHKHVYTNISR